MELVEVASGPLERAFGLATVTMKTASAETNATIPGLTPREQAKASAYLQGFFADVDSGRIFRSCVN